MNELFRALQGMGADPATSPPFCVLCGTGHSFGAPCERLAWVRRRREDLGDRVGAKIDVPLSVKNELLRIDQERPKPLDLEYRGKSVRLLTPDEVVAFAEWAYRRMEQLRLERKSDEKRLTQMLDRAREERDHYLGRAITAEAEAALKPNNDTREERDMDLGINGRRSYCGED